MKKIFKAIRADKDIARIKKEWLKLGEEWWSYNYDEYGGIEDYKEKLKAHLKKIKK